MAGHPLRPANDHSLGRPLPYQLANRARAPPSAPYGFHPCGSYAELASLSRGYSPLKGRLPTCYAPVRRAPSVLLQTRTRLACVKHAASVRSEPGSNSRLNLVAWRKKIFRSFDRNQPAKRIVDRSNLLSPLALEKLQWFRTDSGTSYRLSKSEAPLSCRKAHPQPKKYAKSREECQHDISDIHRRPQQGMECLGRGRMRRKSDF